MPDDVPVVPTPEPAAPAAPAPEAFKPIESQDELNRILAENKRNLRAELEQAKAENEALRPKAARADELEAANMTAQEKLAKERDDAIAEAADLKAREQARERADAQKDAALAAAKEIGYPSADKALALAKYLEGETPEDLAASAKTLFADFKPSSTPLPAAVHDVQPAEDTDPFRAGMKNAMK